MTKPSNQSLALLPVIGIISLLMFTLLAACTSSPSVDQRSALIQTAEKSLALGVSNYNENNFRKADKHFERALFLFRNIDNPDGITVSYLNIAKSKLSSGQIQQAQLYVDKAQSMIDREHLDAYQYHLTLIKSSIAIELEEFKHAKRMLDSLLELDTTNNAPSLDSSLMQIAALQNRTRIAISSHSEDANSWLNQYRSALNTHKLNNRSNRARLLRFEAKLNPGDSEHKLNTALSLYREEASSPGIAATLTEWAKYETSKSRHIEAINKLQRALFIRSNLQDRRNCHDILKQLAINYKQIGDTEKIKQTAFWLQAMETVHFNNWGEISKQISEQL